MRSAVSTCCAGGFALAPLFPVAPRQPAGQHGGQRQRSGQPLPKHSMSAAAAALRRRRVHHPALQAGRRGPALEGMAQLLFKIVHRFKLHALSFTRTYSFKWLCRLGPQQLQSPLQMALHRGQRRFERGRNLLRRQVLLIAKNQRRALRLGQRRQQLLQPRAQRRRRSSAWTP